MAKYKTQKRTAEGKAQTLARKARRATKYQNTGPINVREILAAQNAAQTQGIARYAVR